MEESKWEIFGRKEKEVEGFTYFFERWVHPAGRSGIVFFNSIAGSGRQIFVVEGYGVGTIDPKTFTELVGMAPIQRTEWLTEEEGRAALKRLMEENVKGVENEMPEVWDGS